MIRNLLATTAIATLVATGAYAQTQTTPAAPAAPVEQAAPQVIHADGHLASNIIGETVYNGIGDSAENIGSVQDLVISQDGDVEALVVGVGGFLGLGRKDVALEYNLAEWAERDGNRWLVINTSREALEALPDFDSAAYRPMPADATVGNTAPATAQDLGAAPAATDGTTGDVVATAPAETTMEAMQGTDATHTGAIDRSTLTAVETTNISADEFIGTTVYGANEENVGSVSDVIVSENDGIEAVVLDVGGFLGIGSKPVAVSTDNLAFMADTDGNHYVYTPFTKEQLESQAEYDAATYEENRDGVLLIVPAQ